MQKERSVYLNESGEWLLYRAMVCDALDKNPNVKKMIDCDPWEFSSALDMSFEETKNSRLKNGMNRSEMTCKNLSIRGIFSTE